MKKLPIFLAKFLQQPHLVSSFILTGQQRALLDQLAAEEGLIGTVKLLHFNQPELPALQEQVKRWCAEEKVSFDAEVSKLAINQLDSNLFYLRSITTAASERKLAFDKSTDFANLYVAELLQGRFAHYFSRLLRQVANGRNKWISRRISRYRNCFHLPRSDGTRARQLNS